MVFLGTARVSQFPYIHANASVHQPCTSAFIQNHDLDSSGMKFFRFIAAPRGSFAFFWLAGHRRNARPGTSRGLVSEHRLDAHPPTAHDVKRECVPPLPKTVTVIWPEKAKPHAASCSCGNKTVVLMINYRRRWKQQVFLQGFKKKKCLTTLQLNVGVPKILVTGNSPASISSQMAIFKHN